MLFKWMSGRENISDSSARVLAWYSYPKPGTHANPKTGEMIHEDTPLGLAISSGALPKNSYSSTAYNSVAGAPRDVVGCWYDCVANLPEGTLIKLFISCTNRRDSNPFDRDQKAVLYLRLRDEAAHTELKIPLTGHRHAMFQEATVLGNFDVLTTHDLVTQGVWVDPKFRRLLNSSNVNSLVNKRILIPERAPKTRAVQSKVLVGDQVQDVNIVKRVRRIKL